MNNEAPIGEIYDEMMRVYEAEGEEAALEKLKSRFTELPETLQSEILGILLTDAVEKEGAAEDFREDTLEKGLVVMEALEKALRDEGAKQEGEPNGEETAQ